MRGTVSNALVLLCEAGSHGRGYLRCWLATEKCCHCRRATVRSPTLLLGSNAVAVLGRQSWNREDSTE
jgi:hypothetical protein